MECEHCVGGKPDVTEYVCPKCSTTMHLLKHWHRLLNGMLYDMTPIPDHGCDQRRAEFLEGVPVAIPTC